LAKLQGCPKKIFFQYLAEIVLKDVQTRKKEMSKYLHMISFSYLKNIVENLKLKNKYVKKKLL